MTIVFLDFDGVLHPEGADTGELLSRRQIVWSILDACPKASVVFSTTWRLRYSVDTLINLVIEGGGARLSDRFLGATPELLRINGQPPADLYRHRELECLAWLSGNGVRDQWLALDDTHSFFTFNSPHLFAVDYQTGLTDEDAQKIEASLKGLVEQEKID